MYSNAQHTRLDFWAVAQAGWAAAVLLRNSSSRVSASFIDLVIDLVAPMDEAQQTTYTLFSLVRSKSLAFCGTLLIEVLILVQNQNCAQKSLCRDLASLRNHTS